MPPARPRALDDASETSSIITNLKDKPLLGAATGAGVLKGKKAVSVLSNGLNTTSKVGVSDSKAAPADSDPSLPRTDWSALPTQLLHAYRSAYRLPTPSSYTQPHASLIYNSSPSALRAPSAVQARRRLRDLKHQRRKQALTNGNGNGSSKSKAKDKISNKEKEREKENNNTLAQSIEPSSPPATTTSTSTTTLQSTATSNSTAPTNPIPAHLETTTGRQPPISLATAVRKHFNAQQLNEQEAIARFVYVIHSQPRRVWVEGADGDGSGTWMVGGSTGRELRRGERDGGGGGFRLRFRP